MQANLWEVYAKHTIIWEKTSDILIVSINKNNTDLPPSGEAGSGAAAASWSASPSFNTLVEVPFEHLMAELQESGWRDDPTGVGAMLEAVWDSSTEADGPCLSSNANAHIPTTTVIQHTLSSPSSASRVFLELVVNRYAAAGGGTVVLVVARDVTKRTKLHESELRLATSETERRKDTEANRFTRHEVKNALMAMQGRVDGIVRVQREAVAKGEVSASAGGALAKLFHEMRRELDDTLETVLADAMAKEVCNGSYLPRPEKCDTAVFLERFFTGQPVEFAWPGGKPPPLLMLDTQILRFVYVNAVSNALKYGQPGGTVEVFLEYGKAKGDLKLTVRKCIVAGL